MLSSKFITRMAVVALPCFLPLALCAAQTNPEDEPIEDAPSAAVPPTVQQPSTPAANDDTPVSITKSQWENFLARQKQLEDELAALKGQVSSAAATKDDGLDADVNLSGGTTRSGSGNRNYLLLPDISFSGQAKGRFSSDKRDPDRRQLSLAEAEIAIQGDIYPGVRAEAFIVAEPGEDVPFGLEQGFIDFLGIRKGLNIRVGRDFTPFGRTGRQHTHSWLYTRQLIPIRNIVAEEELGGDGVSFSYVLPTKGKLYANATFGVYNGLSGGAVASSNPFGQDLPMGTGAGYDGRFYLGRLLLAHPVGRDGELELGTSFTRGNSSLRDDTDNPLGTGKVDLMGLDVSYRKFFAGNKRLLLRSEYFRNTPSGGLPTSRASGYYGLANLRLNKYADVGLLYESSGYPQAPGERESAMSLIYTKQLTEQFYIRFQGTRGDRPGGSYNEATVQFTWGLGPHTHNLE